MSSYILCYDVCTEAGDKRLRTVARICEGHGRRVQKSVFELNLGEAHFEQLLAQLRQVIDRSEDSVRIYLTTGGPIHSLGYDEVHAPDEPTHW